MKPGDIVAQMYVDYLLLEKGKKRGTFSAVLLKSRNMHLSPGFMVKDLIVDKSWKKIGKANVQAALVLFKKSRKRK